MVYDAVNAQYFVSNAGNGTIYKTNPQTASTLFVGGLNGLLSLAIWEDVLYTSEGWMSGNKVLGFDIETAEKVFEISVPTSVQLNDLVFDENGLLIASDRDANEIYRIDIVNNTSKIIVQSPNIIGPNGLVVNSDSTVLVNSISGDIYEVHTTTGGVSLVKSTGYSNQDGMSYDEDGNLYISSWGNDFLNCKLFYYPLGDFNQEPIFILENQLGMGDFCYNEVDHELGIPNWYPSSITFYSDLPVISNTQNVYERNDLFSCYPNPVDRNGVLHLNIDIQTGKSIWNIKLLNVNGRKIGAWDFDEFGNGQLNLSGLNATPGLYFVIVQNDDQKSWQKIMIE